MTNAKTPDLRYAARHWAERLIDKACVTSNDVLNLRGEYPLGLFGRDDAEALFHVERNVLDKCPSWSTLFAEMLVDHLVWGERPTGELRQDAAEWLLAEVDQQPTAAGLSVLVEVLEEAPNVPSWYPAAVRRRLARNWRGIDTEIVSLRAA